MKFRLDCPHMFPGDIYLEEGTEIGDDTPYAIPKTWAPPAGSTPLDDEAKALYKKVQDSRPESWGNPVDALDIVPNATNVSVRKSPNDTSQPTIPPLLDQLTHPSDLKPGEAPKIPPHITKSLAEMEAERAEKDKREAERANAESEKRANEAVKPPGVTAEPTSGAFAKAPEVPGQGPAPKAPTAPGQGKPHK